MREQEPRLHDDDFDQRFAEIIASLEQDPDFARDADPQAIDAPPADRAPGDAERAVGDARRRAGPPGAPRRRVGDPSRRDDPGVARRPYRPTFDEALDAEDDEHFIPPPPAPLPPQDDLTSGRCSPDRGAANPGVAGRLQPQRRRVVDVVVAVHVRRRLCPARPARSPRARSRQRCCRLRHPASDVPRQLRACDEITSF